MPSPSFSEQLLALPLIEASTILFGFVWGSMIGSFINVVVHRLPLGESIVTTPSRCPGCGMAIRPWHNVPVLGWIMLGGRCRDCKSPINARYPLVEAGCGAIVMILATADLVSGGRWLAAGLTGHQSGIDRLMWGDWSLLATCALHAAGALWIVTWSLLDGVPWRLRVGRMIIPILLSLVAVAVIPTAGPPAIWPGAVIESPIAKRLVTALAGMAVGGLLGLMARGQGVHWGLPLAGTVLGWQVITVVAVVTAVTIACVGRVVRWPALPGLVLASVCTLAMAFGGGLMVRLVGS